MLHIFGKLIRDQSDIHAAGTLNRLLHPHHRVYLRNDGSFALLGRRLGDPLPSGHLPCRFLLVQFHHTAPGRHRDDLIYPQLHRLLYDQLHLIRLRQPLKKKNPGRQFHAVLFDKPQRADHLVLRKSFYTTAILSAVNPIADRNLLSRLHAQHIPYMVDITARDDYFPVLYLLWFNKKLIHIPSMIRALTFIIS